MTVISYLNISSVILENVIDASALAILMFPVIYFWVYIPLKNHITTIRFTELDKRHNDNQLIIKDLLLLSLNNKKLDIILQEILDKILSVTWLNIESKGAIFLADESTQILELKAFKNLNKSLLNYCSTIKFGKCLCGKAALTREIVYSSHIDEEHHVTYSGILPHGHYCLPIIYNNILLGVLNVYIKDGTKYSETDVTFLKNIAAAIGKIIVNYNDKESIKKLNETLIEKNKQLEQATFIMSHDLQEPLQTITSFTEIINKNYSNKINTNFDNYFKFISSSAVRMSKLIQSILMYSVLGKNSKIEKIDINEILRITINDLKDNITSTNTSIIFENLPNIFGFKTEIKQLFNELITNSIKFKKQNITPIIEIKCYSDSSNFLFSIQDNGIGIDAKHYDKIFQIFQRLHNRNEYDGVGIGLANCKKIIELHSGKIWVESILDKGTTFYFTISKNIVNS